MASVNIKDIPDSAIITSIDGMALIVRAYRHGFVPTLFERATCVSWLEMRIEIQQHARHFAWYVRVMRPAKPGGYEPATIGHGDSAKFSTAVNMAFAFAQSTNTHLADTFIRAGCNALKCDSRD